MIVECSIPLFFCSLTAKSLDTFGGYRSFDEVFIDETVVNILYAHFVPSNVDPKDIYQYLIDNEITNIFKRKKSTGKFSTYCVNVLGFPDDEKFG